MIFFKATRFLILNTLPGFGLELKDARMEHLGAAKKIIVKKDTTTIVGSAGDPSQIDKRLSDLKYGIEHTEHEFDRNKMKERYNKLSGNAVILRIGAATETELHEKYALAENALKAAKAAVSEGCLPGGGIAYLSAAKAIRAKEGCFKGDERIGALLLADALEAPVKVILDNAGLNGAVIRNKIIESKSSDFGYDVLSGEYCNMFEAGIVDPLTVCLAVVDTAASSASMLITTNH